ncbi:bifunctional DNA-formamidopyrimidine glycosylase/DNA-(apurinic or apyrimidinic site) lyase [Comamonas sp. BIGb0124]|uniref:bifunctional DNA-formamidopyrimidine glycosylase/DNA-(apurinic or apyrimidinic site) lyase n=1 Tax=Comamonas sp. BIGb0124 TaxID=2485130 RepID=UPI000F4AEE00|nr:bifunctional DNA-formamidopyrimidine glycosylase/DNA-(apurinic or apyrimidinic site) lyase [Comamonas sp. BIGb0124]
MPELPEVEVTRLSFADRIQGARVLGVRLGKPLRWPLGCEPSELVGAQVLGVRRRGKYLLLDIQPSVAWAGAALPAVADASPEPHVLLLHLGMSGSLRFADALPPAGDHDHFDLHTDRGWLRLHDPRRFGAVVWARGQDDPVAVKLLGRLGVEPLTDAFDAQAFHARLKLRRAPIKQVLLAGDVVVGVGNIYASEALFLAGIRPTTSAHRISLARAIRLHRAIRDVLARAVERGGSTLRDFQNAQGQGGYFQLEAMVYDRAGQPCRICGSPIRQIVQGQRSTYYCPQCQKA